MVINSDRGLRLLEFASYNDLIVANTLGNINNREYLHGIHQMVRYIIRLIIS